MTQTFLPQQQKEKSEHRESSRLRSQPRKDYKTFIPQSKILKKVEFQKLLSFSIHRFLLIILNKPHFQNIMLKNNRTDLVQIQSIEITPNKTLYTTLLDDTYSPLSLRITITSRPSGQK